MSRQRIEFEPAYLLSLRPYRETSQLLELLSRNHGRIGLVARGARGPKAKQRGLLAPFRPLLLSWVEGGDLGTMTGVEAAGPEITLAGERIFHGWYVNELLLKLLQRHDPHPALHDDYGTALNRLAGSGTEAEAALRVFEKRLLEQLGYGLPLDADFEAETRYAFRPAEGFVPTPDPERSFAGSSLRALRDERLDTREALRDARRLLRTALEPHAPVAALRTPRLLRELRASGFGRPEPAGPES
ncbi:MAG: DNA repair protein RecO [Nevskia sp.]